jgi:hypothetical protein
VAAAGYRIFAGCGERQGRVVHHIYVELAGTFLHEGAAAVMQEGDVRVARDAAHHSVDLMAGAADGVEAFVARTHGAGLDVLVPREHLRLEQLKEVFSG